MNKRLELLFTNEGGKNVTISLDAPKEPVSVEAVSEVMNLIIANNVFTSHNGALVQKRGARVVDRSVQQIEIAL
ncbi:DUF2922 domain-containing protein [Evansella sp. AB-rgal1]|uniref:DUF2922 domain-containing protein n=1 Tax=Evansella sp. AB-rgal1 TaxID=3242696 RepID=UPI00359E6FF5